MKRKREERKRLKECKELTEFYSKHQGCFMGSNGYNDDALDETNFDTRDEDPGRYYGDHSE